MPLKIFNMKGPEWEKYTDELLDMAEISEYASAYPLEISEGMKQRTGVIRALVHKPEILLMDEPFGALDEINREALDFELLDIWQKMKKTIVFITHNVLEAVLLSSRVIVMGTNPGRILDEINIDIPYPRNPDMFLLPEFKEYQERITKLIGELDISKII
jgi:NitT/TauT family transport system ATP-binding protein